MTHTQQRGPHARNSYRSEIDGLRAFAVASVVAYHLRMGVPGGFVGVDVFFVISGFLITSIILKEIKAGTFTFWGFWEKRARRIIPASLLVSLITVIAGWFLLLPRDCKDLGYSAAAHSAFAANVFFWKTINYFSGSAHEKPLLHMWSLAVEEQFYFVVPFLIYGLWKGFSTRASWVLPRILGVCAVGSLFLSAMLTYKHSTSSFYLLHSRAWELLIGALVSMLPSPATQNKTPTDILTILGIIGLVLPLALYNDTTPFPGLAAIVPCLGTACVIWSSSFTTKGPITNALISLLSCRGVVFVGLISYSVYLWHWPFVAYCNYWAVTPSLTGKVGLLSAILLISSFSWKWVEQPFRHRSICGSRRSVLSFAGAGLFLLFMFGVGTAGLSHYEKRFSDKVLRYAKGASDRAFIANLSPENITKGRLTLFGETNTLSPVHLLVWGDSHAMSVLPALDELARGLHMKGVAATHSLTPPLLGFKGVSGGLTGRDLEDYNNSVLNFVTSNSVPNVLLVAWWSGYVATNEFAPPICTADEAGLLFERTVAELRKAGTMVWVMSEVPAHRANVPRILARCEVFGGNPKDYAGSLSDYKQLTLSSSPLFLTADMSAFRIIDPSQFLLSRDGSTFLMEQGGAPLYRDSVHLTTAGARQIRSAFEPIFFSDAQHKRESVYSESHTNRN
jgi:peptidoglycan/LPS O-acetylase OafA/YrhL